MGRGGATARRGRAAKGAKAQAGKDGAKSTGASNSAQGAKSTRGKKAVKTPSAGAGRGGKAPVSTTSAQLPARTVPARSRRKPSRYTTEVTLNERDRHQNEGNALSDGMQLLDLFRTSLRKISEENTESGKADATRRGKELMEKALHGHKIVERDWASFDVLWSMSEALDLESQPSLEYTLGVLGVTELPHSLEERSRARGAKAYNTVYRNSQSRRVREERERKTKENMEKMRAERERKMEEKKEKEKEKKKTEHSEQPKHDESEESKHGQDSERKEGEKDAEDVVQGVGSVTISEAPEKISKDNKEDEEDQVMADNEGSTNAKTDDGNSEKMDTEPSESIQKAADQGTKRQTHPKDRKDKNADQDEEMKDMETAEKALPPGKQSQALPAQQSGPKRDIKEKEQPVAGNENTGSAPQSQGQVRRSSRLKASDHPNQQELANVGADLKESDKRRSIQSKAVQSSSVASKGTETPKETTVSSSTVGNTTGHSAKKTEDSADHKGEGQTITITEGDPTPKENPRPFTRLPKRKGRSRFDAKTPSAKVTRGPNTNVQGSVAVQTIPVGGDANKDQGPVESDAHPEVSKPASKSAKHTSESEAVRNPYDMNDSSQGGADASKDTSQNTAKADTKLPTEEGKRSMKDSENNVSQRDTGVGAAGKTDDKESLSKTERDISGSGHSAGTGKGEAPGRDVDADGQVSGMGKKSTSRAIAPEDKSSSADQTEKQNKAKDSEEKVGRKKPISVKDHEQNAVKSTNKRNGDEIMRTQPEKTNREESLPSKKTGPAESKPSLLSGEDAKDSDQKLPHQGAETKPKRALTTKELEKETMAAVFGDSDSDDEMDLDQTKPTKITDDDLNDGDGGHRGKENGTKSDKSAKETRDVDGASDTPARVVRSKGKGRGRRRAQKGVPEVAIAKPERRISSRRHSTRDDIVIPQSRHTRLRRESTNLNDGRLMLETEDEHMLQCAVVWQKVQREKISIPFRQPVQKKDAPDYFEIVKKPMDLATVKKNMEGGIIKSPVDFYVHMMQIVKNAFIYNPKDSDLWELATELRVVIRDATRPIVTEWCESKGQSYEFSDDDQETDQVEENGVEVEEPEAVEVQKRKKRPGRPPKNRKVEVEIEPVPSSKRGRGRGRGRARGRRGGGATRATTSRKRALDIEPDSMKPKKRRVGRPRKDGT